MGDFWVCFHWSKVHYFRTSAQLENEIIFLKQHLQRVMRILHGNGIDVEEQSSFHVNMLFTRETIMQSRFRQVMQEEFDYRVDDAQMIDNCLVSLRPQLGNFLLHIELNFVDRISPFIRTAYPRQHSTRHETNEAITQGRISSRITGVLLSTFMGSPMPFFQCRIWTINWSNNFECWIQIVYCYRIFVIEQPCT